jgi:GMP synthase (glutamine-hydrolysing)
VYGDHIFTLQGHPEFSREFEEALIRLRTGAVFPKEKASEAIETMTVDPDTKVLAQWMASFFQAQRP